MWERGVDGHTGQTVWDFPYKVIISNQAGDKMSTRWCYSLAEAEEVQSEEELRGRRADILPAEDDD